MPKNKKSRDFIANSRNVPIYDVARFGYFSRSGVKAASGVKAEVVKAKKPCSMVHHSKISQLARSIGVW